MKPLPIGTQVVEPILGTTEYFTANQMQEYALAHQHKVTPMNTTDIEHLAREFCRNRFERSTPPEERSSAFTAYCAGCRVACTDAIVKAETRQNRITELESALRELVVCETIWQTARAAGTHAGERTRLLNEHTKREPAAYDQARRVLDANKEGKV